MKRLLLSIAMASAVLTGCTTMSGARYNVSVDNNQALKAHAGAAIRLATLDSVTYDANCRLAGPIKPLDGMTIPQLIQKAFNDEFKFADVYSENGIALNGKMDKIAFSSSEGLTNGWWDLGITLSSSNGRSMSVSNRYDFKSGFDAMTACNHTAQALGPAIQDLIKKVVTDPAFGSLVR